MRNLRIGPLANRDFARLFVGATVSYVGDGVYTVAVAWQAFDLSERPGLLALVGLAWSVGLLAFAPIGGVLSDRIDRRRLMFTADAVRALVLLVLGLLSASGALRWWMLLALIVPYGAGQGLYAPAHTAFIPQVVARDQLVRATAFDQVSRQLARGFVGPALGGVLVATAGAGPAFLLDAISFVISAACVWSVAPRPMPSVARARPSHQFREGIAYVRARPWLWGTIISFSVWGLCTMGPLQILLPYIVRTTMGGTSADYGLVLGAQGGGAILCAVIVATVGVPARDLSFMTTLRLVGILPLIGFAFAAEVWQLALLGALWGASSVGSIVVWNARIASAVPTELTGRVSSVDWFVSIGLAPASFALTAPIVAAVGTDATLVGAAVVAGVVALAMYLFSGMRADQPARRRPARSSAPRG